MNLSFIPSIAVLFIVFHNLFLKFRSRAGRDSSVFVRMVLYVPMILLLVTMTVRRGWPLSVEMAALLSLMQYGISHMDWSSKKGEPHRITYQSAFVYLSFILTFILEWFSVVDMVWVAAPLLTTPVLASYYGDFMTKAWPRDVDPVKEDGHAAVFKDSDDGELSQGITEREKMEDLYERIVTYMESEKPYLDEDLQMDKLAAAVYTNKTYLSRAINAMSGRNFCQFVNYYRINYAVQLMNRDHRVKVSELALIAGFHTVVSFNMAFKLYMNTTPSEYLRTLQAKALENKMN